jgi:hypothetical protein
MWGIAAGASCSATNPSTAGGAGGGGAAGSVSSSASGSGGSPTLTGAASGSGGGGCSPCSADLKNVVDCDGNVIEVCAAGMACAGGVCVADPCDAAKQSKSSVGCEYWALGLDSIMFGACYAAYVTNTWTVPIKIQVEHGGNPLPVAQFTKIPVGQGAQLTYSPYDDAVGLAPGNVAILFLAQSANQPGPPLGQPCPPGITPALMIDPAVHGTGLGQAFHITTDGPVVAYQIFPYGGGNAAITSATLLLPTSAWDVNYIAVGAYAKTQIMSNWGLPSLNMLAGEDGTDVTISPVAAIVAGNGVAGTPQGTPITYSLSKGQYVQFTQDADLTGSAILATKPIAVFGGSSCMNIPVDIAACDTGQQQIPPVRALGHEYAAVRYRGRNGGSNESVPWRIVGAIDGTQLTYAPSAPTGAPVSLASGQVVEFDAPGPFLVASQDNNHPFYVSGHMTGGDSWNGEGDPEFVNIIPTAQYLDSYVFFTDPTYPETNLVLVRAPGQTGFADVTLDCSGVVTGWQPLGPYEYARVDLVTGNWQNVNGCANGAHYISSMAPFGVTVWGWGSLATFPVMTQYVSYAYPAGAGVKPVNTTSVPPIPK